MAPEEVEELMDEIYEQIDPEQRDFLEEGLEKLEDLEDIEIVKQVLEKNLSGDLNRKTYDSLLNALNDILEPAVREVICFSLINSNGREAVIFLDEKLGGDDKAIKRVNELRSLFGERTRRAHRLKSDPKAFDNIRSIVSHNEREPILGVDLIRVDGEILEFNLSITNTPVVTRNLLERIVEADDRLEGDVGRFLNPEELEELKALVEELQDLSEDADLEEEVEEDE